MPEPSDGRNPNLSDDSRSHAAQERRRRTRWRRGVRKQAARPSKSMKIRANGFILVVTLFFALALVVNIFRLTILQHDELTEIANARQFRSVSIPAMRGSIYDANGTILAQSATVYRIFLDPGLFKTELESIETKNETLRKEAEKKAQKGENVVPDIVDTVAVKNALVSFLAQKLKMEESALLESFEKQNNYVILKKQVEKSTADAILAYVSSIHPEGSKREISLASIRREPDTKRYYPQNELAASVIGFNNSDGVGMYGIESYYNDYLSGIDGKTITATDANGKEMPYRYSKTYAAQDGDDVYLTIDTTLQTYLENSITDMVQTYEVANRACGVILNAKTGAILAMATVPGFDLNAPFVIYDQTTQTTLDAILDEKERNKAVGSARERQWRNKCITETYIPGSVFKVFTASSALEENVITYQDQFYCKGHVDIAGTPFHCWKTTGHGAETFEQILTNSCNPAFIDIGQRMGAELFFRYFKAFGLTEKTGIDLPGETSSVYQRLEGMGLVELASCSFGQTNSLSPIEVVTGYAAAVNGGNLLQPYVVSKIVDNEGNVVLTNEKVVRRQVISAETSAEMRSALQAVVENNGGSNAYIKGYKIGGKSGTSQILSGDYDANNIQYVASYCCFAPADDPEVVMLIMADQPNTKIDYYGSTVVVPYARATLEKILPYMGFYPEYTEEEQKNLDVTVPLLIDSTVEDAEAQLKALGLVPAVIGEGTMVNLQTPITGSVVSKGSTVLIDSTANATAEFVTVPEVVGLTMKEANQRLTAAGLNFVAEGASTDRTGVKVLLQSVTPGTLIEKWSVINLDLGISDQSG